MLMQLIHQFLKKTANGGCLQICAQQESATIILNCHIFSSTDLLKGIGPSSMNPVIFDAERGRNGG